jgi:integrase
MDARTISWFPLDRVGELESAILEQLDDRRRSRRRDALACALGLSGLRSGEVSQLVLGDLSVPLRRLRVRTLKGGPERALVLDETLVRELIGWRGLDQARLAFAKLGPEQLLLPSQRGTMVRREQFNRMAVGMIDGLLGAYHGLTFHSLRHTFAMRAYQESRDLFLVQRMLGHSSVQTTEIYARSLAELPEACRVKLGRNQLAERMRVIPLEATG